MFRLLSLFLMALTLAGCSESPRYVDYFPYHDDGIAKPRVAIIPMIDNSNKVFPCDASEQFTRGISYEMMDHAELYLTPQKDVQEKVARLGHFDFFIKDQALDDLFCEEDFVIIMELIEHNRVSTAPGSPEHADCNKDIYGCHDTVMMKIRVRILDVRRRSPSVVLQEVMNCSYIVPCQRQDRRACNPCVDTPNYRISPAGQAHQRMINKVVERLECVIRGAR